MGKTSTAMDYWSGRSLSLLYHYSKTYADGLFGLTSKLLMFLLVKDDVGV
jgi:hypothetical protein